MSFPSFKEGISYLRALLGFCKNGGGPKSASGAFCEKKRTEILKQSLGHVYFFLVYISFCFSPHIPPPLCRAARLPEREKCPISSPLPKKTGKRMMMMRGVPEKGKGKRERERERGKRGLLLPYPHFHLPYISPKPPTQGYPPPPPLPAAQVSDCPLLPFPLRTISHEKVSSLDPRGGRKRRPSLSSFSSCLLRGARKRL